MLMMGDTLQIVGRRCYDLISHDFVLGVAELILKFFLQGFGGAHLPEVHLYTSFLRQLINLVFEAGDTGHEGLRL